MKRSRQLELKRLIDGVGATKPCARCGGMTVAILAEGVMPVGEGKGVEVVTLMCNGCGHTWQHSITQLEESYFQHGG